MTGRLIYTTSSDGPQCPHCLYTATPDDADYYRDSYETECGGCGRRFEVVTQCDVTWHCTTIMEKKRDGERRGD
jgi:hypothetical protein